MIINPASVYSPSHRPGEASQIIFTCLIYARDDEAILRYGHGWPGVEDCRAAPASFTYFSTGTRLAVTVERG